MSFTSTLNALEVGTEVVSSGSSYVSTSVAPFTDGRVSVLKAGAVVSPVSLTVTARLAEYEP